MGKRMKNIDKSLVKGEITLLLVAILWGSCFAFQKKGMDYIGPYTLGALRFIIGGLVLGPVMLLLCKSDKNSSKSVSKLKDERKTFWIGGILCGTVLFLGASFQQVGLVYTTASKAAFLTSMEIVVVGIASIIITKKKQLHTIVGVVLAVSGMYLLCSIHGLSIQFGDLLELIGAFFWAIQLLVVSKYVKLIDPIKLSFVQFLVAGSLSAVGMILFEEPNLRNIILGAVPIVYTAIIEVAICYTLQAIGQKYVPPIIASVTMSLESVFAVIFGVIILNEILSGREIAGMIIMFIAVIVIQLPIENQKTRKLEMLETRKSEKLKI